MLVGHLAVGMLGKRAAPKLSLGNLVLAGLLADLLWCIFMIAGLEHLEIIQPGTTLMNSVVRFDTPYSHGLLPGVIYAALCAWLFRNGRWVIAAAVLSHWLLDFISHNADMAIAPGVPVRLGLGLWNSIPATLAVEGGLWLLALMVYVRTTPPRGRVRAVLFWLMVILLTAAWWNNIAGPPPPNPSTMGISSLIFFSLIVGWAYWMDREPSPSPPAARAPAAPEHPIPPEHPPAT